MIRRRNLSVPEPQSSQDTRKRGLSAWRRSRSIFSKEAAVAFAFSAELRDWKAA